MGAVLQKTGHRTDPQPPWPLWVGLAEQDLEFERSFAIALHYRLLGHRGYGVTELRTFDKYPQVAYVDDMEAFVRLCLEMDGKVSGVYVGVNPRPLHFFDFAPNRWVPAKSRPESNCAGDRDIEYVANIFFDIDVASPERGKNRPASEAELQNSLKAALGLYLQKIFRGCSTVCCSGNGHYLLVNLEPMEVEGKETGLKIRKFEERVIEYIHKKYKGVKCDPVNNLSRVMRVIGTMNLKGEATKERPHRRSGFVTWPSFGRSEMLRARIEDIRVNVVACDLPAPKKDMPANLEMLLKECLFVKWCWEHPEDVSEVAWFQLITNLAYLRGGQEFIHEISKRDPERYDKSLTDRYIKRCIEAGYQPTSCRRLVSVKIQDKAPKPFDCPKIGKCRVKAPMYLAIKMASRAGEKDEEGK